jgi:hypothetical protein
MGSHHVFSQLVLLALLWLFVILHLSWPKHAVTALAVPTEPEPLQRVFPAHFGERRTLSESYLHSCSLVATINFIYS